MSEEVNYIEQLKTIKKLVASNMNTEVINDTMTALYGENWGEIVCTPAKGSNDNSAIAPIEERNKGVKVALGNMSNDEILENLRDTMDNEEYDKAASNLQLEAVYSGNVSVEEAKETLLSNMTSEELERLGEKF